jgi:uncharacterized membrane protein HdeD (DUF308 family)
MTHAETETLGTRRHAGQSRVRPTIAEIFSVRERVERVGRYWWLLLLTGIAWIVVAAIVFRFDYSSVIAVAILFGVLAIAVGTVELTLAMISRRWWRLFHALLGVIFIATGVTAFFKPGNTFVGLAAVISFYFIFAGVWDVVSSLSMRSVPGWWIQLVSGLVELGLGYWAAGSWRVSASLLVAFVAALALIRGISQICDGRPAGNGARSSGCSTPCWVICGTGSATSSDGLATCPSTGLRSL